MLPQAKDPGAAGQVADQTPPFDWRRHLRVHPAAELFPLMPEAELKELAEDIEKNGVSSRIVLWPASSGKKWLLDGRNRLDALALLGLLTIEKGSLALKTRPHDHPFEFECAYQHSDPYALALSLNVHRRHLNSEQKRDLIAKVLKAKPDASNLSIAKQVKVDDKTVASVRRDLESTSEIPKLEKTVGKDGIARKTPAKKKTAQPAADEVARDRAECTAGATATPTLAARIAVRPKWGKTALFESVTAIALYKKAEAAEHELAQHLEKVAAAKASATPELVLRDTALDQFDAHILELVCRTKEAKSQDFLKTAVPTRDLYKLAVFLTELVTLKKLTAEALGQSRLIPAGNGVERSKVTA